MTNLITEAEAEVVAAYDKLKTALTPAAKTVEAEAEAAGSATFSYIKNNGLNAAYQIALSVVGGAAAGAPWLTTLATIVSEAKAAGVTIIEGAESILGAQAQADLIAAGKLLPPKTATAA